MVTIQNSFVKRNCMQPVRNSATCSQCAPFFLAPSGKGKGRGGGGGGHPPWFPMCYYHILNGFPSRSQFVPNVLVIFSRTFQRAPLFYPICFDKCCPPLTYIDRPKGRNRTFRLWGLLHV
jgi:hypothetical protein